MSYTQEKLEKIFERTDGRCHICRYPLTFSSYGKQKSQGNWEVEHSKPRSQGGTDHLNNLYPACISCNREKGTNSTRYARGKNGFSTAPLSKQAKADKRANNAFSGGAIGLVAAALLRTTPMGLVVTTVAGVAIGLLSDPEKD